jgi:hypothetical protein
MSLLEKEFTLVDALTSLRTGAEWYCSGELILENVVWQDPDIIIPTQEECDNRIRDLQAIYNNLEYQRLRASVYPPLADLADALYWQANGDASKMTLYLAQVAAVKNKYPKGTR